MNKTVNNRFLGIAAITALLAGIYVSSDGFAHGPGYPGWGGYPGHMMGGHPGYHGMGPGMMGGHMMHGGPAGSVTPFFDTATIENRLTALKNQLAITPEQEKAWTDYVKTLTDQVKNHTTVFNTMHGAGSTADGHWQAMRQMLDQNQKAYQAYQALYEQLDARQRGIAGQLSFPCHG